MVRTTGPLLIVALLLAGCRGSASSGKRSSSITASRAVVTPAQRLRRCVDRWNQGRMEWGPTVARALARPRCTVVLAYTYSRGDATCSPDKSLPAHPGLCLDRAASFTCTLDRFEAYFCPSHADRVPVRKANADVGADGRLRLHRPLARTHATSLRDWQRRYTYRDGYIYPWTRNGKLRTGLKLVGHFHGQCSRWSDISIRCVAGSLLIYPCYPQRATWHRGTFLAACPTAPGATRFYRVTGSAFPS
jgi:hypothetical protein